MPPLADDPSSPAPPPRPWRAWAVIAGLVLALSLAFAWVAGWIGPSARLTAPRLVDDIENGKPYPGFRRAHSRGVCVAGHFVPTAQAAALSTHLLPNTRAYYEIWLDEARVAGSGEEEDRIYGDAYLPRKFKIGFAIPPYNDVDVFAHDLGFVAVVEDARITGYNVSVGGGMGMTHNVPTTFPRLADVVGFCEPTDVLAVAEHTMCIQRDYGNRKDRSHARFKYTIEERGTEWFRAELADRLGDLSRGTRALDNLSIGLAEGVTGTDLGVALQGVRETQRVLAREYTARELPKFAECLPPDLASATVAIRYSDADSVTACLGERIRSVAAG